MKRLEAQKKNDLKAIQNLRTELAQKQTSHEDEVTLRLQYENRINALHALNRTFNVTAIKNDKMVKELQADLKEAQAVAQSTVRKYQNSQYKLNSTEQKKQIAEVTSQLKDTEMTSMRQQISRVTTTLQQANQENLKLKQQLAKAAQEAEAAEARTNDLNQAHARLQDEFS